MFATFLGPTGTFRGHPLEILRRHGVGLGIPHEFLAIDENNLEASLRGAFKFLKAEYDVETIITGDILSDVQREDGVDWWKNLTAREGLNSKSPLSSFYAEEIIELLGRYNITAIVTSIAECWYAEEFLGQPLSLELLKRHWAFSNPEFDICGEKGEYHTTVVSIGERSFCDLPYAQMGTEKFNGNIVLKWSQRWLDPAIQRRAVSLAGANYV